MTQKTFDWADTEATVAFGHQLAQVITSGLIIYLHGDLGAGKTTFSRGLIQGMGFEGNVKSPTYTLVEPYQLDDKVIYHFDLYRLQDAEELEYMGIRDYLQQNAICLIEWAEKGKGIIPPADLSIHIRYHNQGRQVNVIALSENGRQLLAKIA